ncbi:MAG TPA: hypothetical protein VGM81_22355 [Burkholderiaceae bacterium]|jgi:hypothetical protein
MALHLVPKVPKPARSKRQEVLDGLAELIPATILKCPRCGSLELIETRIGVQSHDGKTSGGTKALICLHCMIKGERILVR